jgi:hypothetical protein
LKDWFKNRTRPGTAGGEGKSKFFEFVPKKSWKLPLYQVYSKLYYESKLKEVIEERWIEKYLHENPLHCGKTPAPSMDFRNVETKALLEEESEEVKEEVRKRRDALDFSAGLDDDKAKGDEAMSPEQRERERKAVEFQRYAHLAPSSEAHKPSNSTIDALNRTMVIILDEVYQKTGLIGMALFAGPEPRQGGNLCLIESVQVLYIFGSLR